MGRKALDHEFWAKHLASQETSGLSVRQYAERHDLPLSTFYYVRRRGASPFVPVVAVSDDTTDTPVGDIVITVRASGSVSVDLPESFRSGVVPLLQELLGFG